MNEIRESKINQAPRTETLTLCLTLNEKQLIIDIAAMLGGSIEDTIVRCLFYCATESRGKWQH
jgi:hypothetical protein